MYEINCPSCGSGSLYDPNYYLLTCPFCSTSFKMSLESGRKETFTDHFIVPNTIETQNLKGLVLEWLKRLNNRANTVESEYLVINIHGISIPHWIISCEIHTAWKGLVKREIRRGLPTASKNFIVESGQFRRSYRWAISARKNICEYWGMGRLHEPMENVGVFWDGFPLDSTFSRGRLTQVVAGEKGVYESRQYFDFKYANGVTILGVEVDEEEALRRAKTHVEIYHYELAQIPVNYLIDYRSEFDLAGIQLVHLPFWVATFHYRPRNVLRYFYKPIDKHVLLEGLNGGVLKGEIPVVHRDKVWVNSFVAGIIGGIFFVVGAIWHPVFFLIAMFFGIVSGLSAYTASIKLEWKNAEEKQAAVH